MALNRDRIGHQYPPFLYEVSREKIREYAEATGHDGPEYTAQTGDVVAPPTFAACFTVGRSEWALDPDLGVHPNLVHGSQAYDFHRPVRLGDVLECTTRIADIVDRDRMEVLTVEIDGVDAGSGEPVVTSRAMIIFFR